MPDKEQARAAERPDSASSAPAVAVVASVLAPRVRLGLRSRLIVGCLILAVVVGILGVHETGGAVTSTRACTLAVLPFDEPRKRSRARVPGRGPDRGDQRVARQIDPGAPERQRPHVALQGHHKDGRRDRAGAHGRLSRRELDSSGRSAAAGDCHADSCAGIRSTSGRKTTNVSRPACSDCSRS